MIKLTVSYPNGEGTSFDHDYYKASHVPMCNEVFAPAKTEIEKGVDGQPNAAAVSFYFDSMDALQAAFGNPRMGEVMADVANYTNIQPAMQVSEIVA
jgi:uncharacterized protein (TIGR02118 family)